MTTTKMTAAPPATGIDGYVARYKKASKKCCEQVLEQARVIKDAEHELSGRDRDAFFAQIGVPVNGATHRKLKKIHEQRVRFEPFLERLPSTWTTLYGLAMLKDHDFDKLTQSDILKPLVQWNEIQEFLGTGSLSKATCKVAIDIEKVAVARRKDFMKKLQGLLDEYNLPLEASKENKATLTGLLGDDAFQMEQAA